MKSIIEIFNGSIWRDAIFQIDISKSIRYHAKYEDILGFWTRERELRHRDFFRHLTLIHQVLWAIEHQIIVCVPRRYSYQPSWITTGTYYHYLSSDDEDSNHLCTFQLRKIKKSNNRTKEMVR